MDCFITVIHLLFWYFWWWVRSDSRKIVSILKLWRKCNMLNLEFCNHYIIRILNVLMNFRFPILMFLQVWRLLCVYQFGMVLYFWKRQFRSVLNTHWGLGADWSVSKFFNRSLGFKIWVDWLRQQQHLRGNLVIMLYTFFVPHHRHNLVNRYCTDWCGASRTAFVTNPKIATAFE